MELRTTNLKDKPISKKTPKNKVLDMENRFGESYQNLAEKYDETYATIYGRIYRRRKKK